MKMIYCDNAATTPLNSEVAEKMNEISKLAIGNPSSIHKFGQESKAIIERARLLIANLLEANLSEIIFTGSGSESNNIALLGILQPGDHLITSTYEHPAVLEVAKYLEGKEVNVTYIKPDESGVINSSEIKKHIKSNTKLISIMFVNNELGTINPINEIANISKESDILFHTDAVQYIGKEEISLKNIPIDLLSLSGHKFYGPKGVGALFIRDGINLSPSYLGGGQEKNIRPGTENIAAIHGLALALEISLNELPKWRKIISEYESIFFNRLKELNINFNVNGENRLPGIINISFHDILGQDLVIALDMNGYAISGGSACSSGSASPPKSLLEIGLDEYTSARTVRISLGKNMSKSDVISLSNCISDIINK